MSTPRNVALQAFPAQRGRDPSAERRRERRQYEAEKKKFLAANPLCALCGRRRKLDLHHAKGRVGKLLLEKQHWYGLCRPCHDWVARNPAEAYMRGLLVKPWNTW
jgi:5-methylcytosine-specific restriction endonuclease McrA